ncbi:lytic transglycosylase domain-containing protein [Xanthomonas oryzae]|uniref:VgrG-related protein n=1 Tax=Xanthomonas oryzae TaxID=347 RepID=UPI001034ABEC|nr:lytic transglycosylase domain-containing protein [Xanthomonas oryzae]QBH01336.1 lytic transglycosylase domain-containing protein [Xanthomonas oryzae]
MTATPKTDRLPAPTAPAGAAGSAPVTTPKTNRLPAAAPPSSAAGAPAGSGQAAGRDNASGATAGDTELAPTKAWAYPFAPIKDSASDQLFLEILATAKGGFYPLGSNGIWHGGVHFDAGTAARLKQDAGIHAPADGEVIAYRLDSTYPQLDYPDGKKALYSTSFVLMRFKLALPPAPKAATASPAAAPAGAAAPATSTRGASAHTPSATGASASPTAPAKPPADETQTFYALFMHLLDWASYKRATGTTSSTGAADKLDAKQDKKDNAKAAVTRAPWWKGKRVFRAKSANVQDKPPAHIPEVDLNDPWKTSSQATPGNASGAPGSVPFKPAASGDPPQPVSGIRIRAEGRGGAQLLGLLPAGSELVVGEPNKRGWAQIQSISSGAPVGPVAGEPAATSAEQGWVYHKELEPMIEPDPLDTVVVLDKPHPVKAGDLMGYLGEYTLYRDATALPPQANHPLVHMEVFTDQGFTAFLSKSRARAQQLPETAKTVLVIAEGAKLVPDPAAADQPIAAGSTLKETKESPKGGRWVKVQPMKPAPAPKGAPGAGKKAASKLVAEGEPVWVERTNLASLGSNGGQGWKSFPLDVSKASGDAVGFIYAQARGTLEAKPETQRAQDAQGVHWWRMELGTADGKALTGWVCEKNQPQVSWMSPWAWPGFQTTDASSVSIVDSFKRFLSITGTAVPEDEDSFKPALMSVNQSELITRLAKIVDARGNKDGSVTALELTKAMLEPWLAQAISRQIILYESEWGGAMDKWGALTPLMKTIDGRGRLQAEIARIKKLQWWDSVAGKEKNFPNAPTVFHLHPVGLIGNFISGRRRRDYDLGKLSSTYETGGRGSITISGGQGDPGGVSYGSYQMTSRTKQRDGTYVIGGTVQRFVNSSGFSWSGEFAGLTPGTDKFSEKWRELVNAHTDEFKRQEHEYIKETHFDLLAEHTKEETGVDIRYHSHALNDVVWSTAVQHGGSSDIIADCIKSLGLPNAETRDYDKKLIEAIYDERGRKDGKGILVHFKSASADQRDGVEKRYKSERLTAQKELEDEKDY